MKWLSFAAVVALCACNSPLSQTSVGPATAGAHFGRHSGSTPIKHVIVIMQENRSFNNLFYGFPGAKTFATGNGHGKTYQMHEIPLKWRYDLNHSHAQFLEDFDNGKADGFDGEIIKMKHTGKVCSDRVNAYNEPSCWVESRAERIKKMAFSYVRRSDIQPYWTMAQEYGLGDNAFSSNNGPTFVSHQYLVAGQSGHSVEVPTDHPWACKSRHKKETVNLLAYGQASPPAFSAATGHEVGGPFPCFDYTTIVANLDAANVTWRYYAESHGAGNNLDPFEANSPVWDGRDRANISSPDTNVLSDIANGDLAGVSWVTPSGSNSDHPGPQSGDLGPSWVGSIVNAVGESKYWDSTAIIVMWDEWGGWYDGIAPQQYADPQTGANEGLGFRVPLIVVSPYAKAGYVSHSQHEIASTLRFIEETFGLPFIGSGSGQTYADQRADGFDDMFDYTQQPIRFKPIATSEKARYFLTHLDNTPGDTY